MKAPRARAGQVLSFRPGLSHLVTRSSSKALMPWAALSRMSSLAGGPCRKVSCYDVDGTRLCSPLALATPSPSLSSSPAICEAGPRTPGPRALP